MKPLFVSLVNTPTPDPLDGNQEIGMINVAMIVAVKRPSWPSHQAPTEFRAINGMEGWIKISYVEFWALFADKKAQPHDGWIEVMTKEEVEACKTMELPQRKQALLSR